MYRGVNINASIKADDVKQFGQVGGNSFNAVSRFFTQAIGETMRGASGEFAQKKRVPTKLRTIYKAANTIINNNLNKYRAIIPCGIKDKGVTNLKQIKNQNYNELDKKLVEIFISNLNK